MSSSQLTKGPAVEEAEVPTLLLGGIDVSMVDKAVSSSTIYIICLLHLLRGQVYQSHLPLASLSRLPLVSLSYLPLSVLLAIGTCATSAD